MRGLLALRWHAFIPSAAWCMLAFCLLPQARLNAQNAVRERFVDSQVRRLDAEAELAALRSLNQELKRSLERRPAAPVAPAVADFHLVGVRETVLRTLQSAETLRKANENRRDAFKHGIDLLHNEKTLALEQYRAALRAADLETQERARIEWELQQPLELPVGWQQYLPPGRARALLLAVGSCVLGALAWGFEERLALRRFARRQGRLGHFLLSAASFLAILVFLGGALLLGWLAFWPTGAFVIPSPEDAVLRRSKQAEEANLQNQHRLASLTRDLDQAGDEFTALHERGLQDGRPVLPADKQHAPGDLADMEREAADQLRTLLQLAHGADRIARETIKLNDQTNREHRRLEAFSREAAAQSRRHTLERVGVVAAPLAFFLLAAGASRLRRWARLHRENRQCPRCLQSKLVPTPRADSPLRDLKCPCGYAFPASVGTLSRLCFPNYGISASGKTTWLTMAYEQLNLAGPAYSASVKSIRTDICTLFDDLARRILIDKAPPDATPPAVLPDPLLYHIVDRAALAPSKVLLSIFDFPGEVASFRDAARHDGSYRALRMDGFIYILDPTGPIEPQIQSLAAFQSAMRELAGLEVNAPLSVPLAVCIAKLDRLPDTPFSRTALPWLAELRQTAREPLTLALLQRRSDMVKRILLDVFQGFDLAAELRKSFGASCLFFPQSNFGLEEAELGLPLEERGALTSFGTLEPVWWLLHMNGLQVLD